MICEVRSAESPPLPAGRVTPEHQSEVRPARRAPLPDDIAATSRVFLANLDDGRQRRFRLLLDTIGLPAEIADSPQTLTTRMASEAAACLLIEPGPAAEHLASWLSAAGPAVPVLCYARQPTIADAVRVLQAGAWSCLEQAVSDHDLLTEIQQALVEAAGRQRGRQRFSALQARFAILTSREREILAGATEGCTNRRIAARLGISHRTVDVHCRNALRKLGVNRFCEVARDFCVLLAYEAAAGGRGHRTATDHLRLKRHRIESHT